MATASHDEEAQAIRTDSGFQVHQDGSGRDSPNTGDTQDDTRVGTRMPSEELFSKENATVAEAENAEAVKIEVEVQQRASGDPPIERIFVSVPLSKFLLEIDMCRSRLTGSPMTRETLSTSREHASGSSPSQRQPS